MKTTLTNPSDESLDFAVAAIVANIPPDAPDLSGDPLRGLYYGDRERRHVPDLTRSMDAVLPLLEKWHWVCHKSLDDDKYTVGVSKTEIQYLEYGERTEEWDKSLPRAACLALLRAHGVEVVLK